MKKVFYVVFLFTLSLNSQNILDEKDRARVVNEILKDRFENLLPKLMDRTRIDMWILISREYNEDPVLKTMLPAEWLNARRRTIILFYRDKTNNTLDKLAVARYNFGENIISAWDKEVEPNQWKRLNQLIEERNPKTIGINYSKYFNPKKAGHTGTLDPLATGLLPVCLGEATKFSSFLLESDKSYDASIKLEFISTTGDSEGEIESTKIKNFPTLEEVQKVINSFLELANNNEIYSSFINNESLKFDIDLEVSYWGENKRNDIDIQIKILDGSYNELHRIIIENKIKSGAANSKQLNLYYQAVINDKDNDDAFELNRENLSVVFLTPKLKNKGLHDEFNNLKIDNKIWLYWNSEDSTDTTIVRLIQDILKLEQEAKISPINEYMRHTLKAFTHYIIKTISISDGKNRVGIDIGELKKKEDVQIGDEIYTIVLRDSGQVQLFNQDGDKVTARPLLRKFLKEKGISEENSHTTRQFGKKIFDYLEK